MQGAINWIMLARCCLPGPSGRFKGDISRFSIADIILEEMIADPALSPAP